MTAAPHIRILMCTLNGAAHMQEQLDSFLAQSHGDWSLWVSDDGSEDATFDILKAFRDAHPERDIQIFAGPRQGVARNYFSLVEREASAPGTLVALSDQDDVWFPDKLARAAAAMGAASHPVAYASAQVLAGEDLSHQRPSRPCPAGPSFGNALVQNILSGNSLVLNAAALSVLRQAMPSEKVPFHDWWIYQVITGVRGHAIYDREPGLIYRQHDANTLGGNLGARALYRRAGLLWGHEFLDWVAVNTAALETIQDLLTPENRDLLGRFRAGLGQGGVRRMRELSRLGVGRQNRTGTAALYLAAALGRV